MPKILALDTVTRWYRRCSVIKHCTAGFIVAIACAQALLPVSRTYASHPAAQAVTDYDIVLVIDESASMWARNDPPLGSDTSPRNPGWRIAAANMLAGALATDQSGASYRIALIMFGAEAKVVFPLQVLNTPQAQTAWQNAITQNHTNMESTNILPALQLAKHELDRGSSSPYAKKLVIFLSDGVCEPVAQTTVPQRRACEESLRTVMQQDYIQGSGYPVTTIALTADAWSQDPQLAPKNLKNLWQEMSVKTGGDYYEAVQAEGDLVAVIAKIQQHIFGLTEPPSSSLYTSPGSQTITLPAKLSQVTFSIVSDDPGIQTMVIRPDGAAVKASDPGTRFFANGLVQTVNVAFPMSGAWSVKSSGAGKVALFLTPDERVHVSIETFQPAGLHAQYKPMEIRARVLDPNHTLSGIQGFKLTVTLPDGKQVNPALEPVGNYYRALLQDTSITGTYAMVYSGTLGTLPFNQRYSVDVQTIPWLRVDSPGTGLNYRGAVPVLAQAMLGNKPLLIPPNSVNAAAVVHLVSADGFETDSALLQPSERSVYSRTLFAATAGAYTVRINLPYTNKGISYLDTTEVSVSILGGYVSAQTPIPTVVIPTAAPVVAIPAPEAPPKNTMLNLDLSPVYIGIGFLAVLLVLTFLINAIQVGTLSGMKQVYGKSVELQDMIVKAWHVREVNTQLASSAGWKSVADQIVANATQEAASFDADEGVLDIATEPSPKFTLLMRDGRQVVFTTNPKSMRRMHLIQRSDRVIDVSAISRVSHMDAGLLWSYVQDKRNMTPTAIPLRAHWYIVIRAAELKGIISRKGLIRPGEVPYLESAKTAPSLPAAPSPAEAALPIAPPPSQGDSA